MKCEQQFVVKGYQVKPN